MKSALVRPGRHCRRTLSRTFAVRPAAASGGEVSSTARTWMATVTHQKAGHPDFILLKPLSSIRPLPVCVCGIGMKGEGLPIMAWGRIWTARGRRMAALAVMALASGGIDQAWVGSSAGAYCSPEEPSASVSLHAEPGKIPPPDRYVPVPEVSKDIAHASEKGTQGLNITIDDGPDLTWTPRILRVRRANEVKATFCMIGPQAEDHPDIVKAVVASSILSR
ncbi:polysaccharide deacetylase family protein [Streptomyces murinus]|uniref:polysaccharide deacetylase family protein n=1 Tax=Streptomyces murinus TaxID=33900 RepID=UPI00382AA95D